LYRTFKPSIQKTTINELIQSILPHDAIELTASEKETYRELNIPFEETSLDKLRNNTTKYILKGNKNITDTIFDIAGYTNTQHPVKRQLNDQLRNMPILLKGGGNKYKQLYLKLKQKS
jgi:hypothetical protein